MFISIHQHISTYCDNERLLSYITMKAVISSIFFIHVLYLYNNSTSALQKVRI